MERYPLVYAAVVFICGIIFGELFIPFPFDLYFLIIIFILKFFTPERVDFWVLSAALLLAGSARLHSTRDILPDDHISLFPCDSILSVTGIVHSATVAKDMHNQYRITVEQISTVGGSEPASGDLIIFSRSHTKILTFGDRILISGHPERIPPVRNPGQFDYQRYLAAQGICYRYRWNAPDSIRILEKNMGGWFESLFIRPVAVYSQRTLNRFLEDNDAALVQALLLGEKQDLEKETISKFQLVGVVHVLAISGLHVGFIIVFAMTGFSLLRVPKTWRFRMLLLILFVYGAVVAFRPPVVRAALMAVFYLWAEKIERKPVTDNLLAGAALAILLVRPVELYNPGFQFSFVAVASILHGAKAFDRWIPLRKMYAARHRPGPAFRWLTGALWMPLLVSFSAVLGTIPLTAYYYGTIPVIALAANLPVIPLIAGIVLLSLFLLLIAPLSGFLAGGIGDLIALIHLLLNAAVDFFARLPLASIHVANPKGILVILWILCFLLLVHSEFQKLRKIVAVLACAVLLIILLPDIRRHQSLDVTFLDVGQGDAAYLRFPNGRTMLIDAGPADPGWDNGRMTLLPFLKQTGKVGINYLLASHAHDDHIGGMLSLLESIRIDTVILSAYPYHSNRFRRLKSYCSINGIPVLITGRGDRIQADPSCRVYVLHPDTTHTKALNFSGSECNNSSIVLKIQYGENGLLFTGDLERTVEPVVLMYGDLLESEILKVGHHGSNTSTSGEFLDAVDPVLAVIPVALKNKFRHPSPKTLQRLADHSVKVYRTSHTGAVMFRIYPDHIEKINWRK
jgi:competence protein ComEC